MSLRAHTKGGLITTGQDAKEDTSNDFDDLLDDAMNLSVTLDVTAGGTFNLDTPQGNLDLYLGAATIRVIGSPAGATTIKVPDGDKRVSFVNETSQNTTIDTVTGATPTVSVPSSASKRLQVRGIEITVTSDDASQTGAFLADGSVVPTGVFDWADFELKRPLLIDFAERASISTPATTVDFDLTTGNVFDITLDQDTTFTFSNPPASGNAGSFTAIFRQDGTGDRGITLPASVDWQAGITPSFSSGPGQSDVVSFMTVDGGTTWFAFLGGLNFA